MTDMTISTPAAPVLLMGDCLKEMKAIPDGSVNLICADPPYYRVKGDAWDNQWKTPGAFLDWMGELCAEWRRVLAPNGSLYVFASPQMGSRVECKIAETFAILNRITWVKQSSAAGNGQWSRSCKEDLRSYFPRTEAIIFAEHHGADSMALGESGYAAKCEQLRGFVFEPLRAYLDGERERSGVTVRQVAEAFQRKTGSRTVTGMAGHWFGTVQWMLPTIENYEWLRRTLASLNGDGEYLRRDYESLRRDYESLRRDYEDLRRDYEDLRRPFTVSSSVPYTDVFDFPTVPHRPGKHPCEKPAPLISSLISASSRPGDTVLDCFMGSGVTGEAALSLGRAFIGIEQDEKWFGAAARRIERAGGRVAHEGEWVAGAVVVTAGRPAVARPAEGREPVTIDQPTRKASRPRRDVPRDDTPMFRFWETSQP